MKRSQPPNRQKRTAAAGDRWNALPSLKAWRKTLRHRYSRTTYRYVAATRIGARGDSSDVERGLRLAGRQGQQLALGRDGIDAADRRKAGKIEAHRRRISAALNVLLSQKPLREISVKELVAAASTNLDTFYKVFRSGKEGAYCFWCTDQLDRLSERTSEVLAPGPTPYVSREAWVDLEGWAEVVTNFMLAQPHGRLPLTAFLLHDIDSLGESFLRGSTDLADDVSGERTRQVNELALLAAGLHRAGARLIHQLAQFFKRHKTTVAGSNAISVTLWPDPDDATWFLAVSFWFTTLTSLLLEGTMEAEAQSRNLRRLAIRAWYAGVCADRQMFRAVGPDKSR